MDMADNSDEQLDKKKQVERIILGATEAAILARWLIQVEAASIGFLTLSKSDVVNFILRGHACELSNRELAQLRQDHYDPVRHMNWIMQRLKLALGSGDTAMVARLQSEIKKIELPARPQDDTLPGPADPQSAPSALAPRKRSSKKSGTSMQPDISNTFKETQLEIPEA